MKIGLVLPMAEADGPGAGTWPRIRDLALLAEAGGIDSLWVYDHLVFRMAGETEDGIHEAWTLLSALAAVTERAELGTIVLGTGFRPPALTAKMAATLDEIANGRLILGLGTGWHEPEYRAFGYPFDHRAGRFEEALEIIVPLLRGERVTLKGRWHDVEDAVLIPAPPRPARMPGRMPILVAAKGSASCAWPPAGRMRGTRRGSGSRTSASPNGARTLSPPARPRAVTRRPSRSPRASRSTTRPRQAAGPPPPPSSRRTPTSSPGRSTRGATSASATSRWTSGRRTNERSRSCSRRGQSIAGRIDMTTDGNEDLPEHVALNRVKWDEWAAEYAAPGERAWTLAPGDETWGIFNVPEAEIHLLPDDLDGLDAIELGCGTGYISAWMTRRGARVVGIDNSPKQLETAVRLQHEHGLDFPSCWATRRRSPTPTPRSTSRSASTGRRSGPIRMPGSPRPRASCGPAAGSRC